MRITLDMGEQNKIVHTFSQYTLHKHRNQQALFKNKQYGLKKKKMFELNQVSRFYQVPTY